MSAPDPTVALNSSAIIRVGSSDTDPMIGREVIGQYRIEKKIGVGGMGAVYLAQQTSVSRPAVIKVLRSQLGGSSDSTARFAVEAKAASSLNHPNIVTIYNYGAMEDGTLFLAMEYIAGETLEQRIQRCGQLPADRAVHIATQIARALGEAHAHGVVHRDLKPANVMLIERAGEDFVKVLDFGIAKVDDAGVTATGYVVGTPRYMSPEQLLGKRLDCRSDIYSAAVVLYEMLAGVTPFQSESPMGWLHQHVDVEPKPPSALSKRGKIAAPIEHVVLRALAKAPGDRPASMEMFALDLVAALNAPIEPPPPPWWRRAVVRTGQLAVVAVLALVAAARRCLRTIGSGAWRGVRAIGSGIRRFVRAIGSGAWRFLRAIGSAARRGVRVIGSGACHGVRTIGSAARHVVRAWRSLRARRSAPVAKPIPPKPVPSPARRRSAWMLETPLRRVLLGLMIVLAFAGLLVALFPAVRADFGLGGDDKPAVSNAKRQPVPAPVRDRSHVKPR